MAILYQKERLNATLLQLVLRIIANYPCYFPSSHEFFKQYYRSFLVQGLVIVAALGRLHAGRAAISAGTCFDSFQSSLPELGYHLKSLLGNADASGVSIVNKNLCLASVGVKRSGNAADVIAVAKGK
jgi:hypothetical protein